MKSTMRGVLGGMLGTVLVLGLVAWTPQMQVLEGWLRAADGEATNAGHGFNDDPDTGAFLSAAGIYNLTTAGVERMEVDATSISMAVPLNLDGAAAAALVVEGTADAFEHTLNFTDATRDSGWTFPDLAVADATVGDVVVTWMQGGTPADALDASIFVADRSYIVTDVDVTWDTAESTGAMDVMVEKLVGVTACGSGTDILAAVVDATATANTTTSPALHATAANYTIAAGDTLCIDLTATPNEIAGLVVTIALEVN